MCLAVPGQIVSIAEAGDAGMTMGKVSFNGVTKDVCLAYVMPEARVGDYVIVHAGFALNLLDEAEAAEVFKLLGEMDQADVEW